MGNYDDNIAAECSEDICNFHLFKSPAVFQVTIHTAFF